MVENVEGRGVLMVNLRPVRFKGRKHTGEFSFILATTNVKT